MIRSMTAYARAEEQGPWGRLAWELRSVNHRYFDLQFKLPDEFRALENELRATAAAFVARGKMEAALRFCPSPEALPPIALDERRLRQLREALDGLNRVLGPTGAAEPMRVLAWPGVLRQNEDAESRLPLAVASSLFRRALEEFSAMRGREGMRTAVFLQERSEALAALVTRVRLRAPQVRAAWQARLSARLNELAVEVEPARLAQEVALAAQRLDVDEELSRLENHLAEVRATLARDEAVGRRLDFLMQELNREANTLSAKSQDADMTRCAVEMKVIIEQMREQVQNIE
jgi:uncharacterized protein (TIGR00255 family)